MFENQNGIARSTVTDNLFARERLQLDRSEGVAIPARAHQRISTRSPRSSGADAIPFEAPDGQPVGLLIFLLSSKPQQHLEILSEIAQLLSDRDARRASARNGYRRLHRLLTQWQPGRLIRAEYFPVRGGTPPFREPPGAGPATSVAARTAIGVTRVMDTSSINARASSTTTRPR